MSQNRDEENPIRDALFEALNMDGPTRVYVDPSWEGVELPEYLTDEQGLVVINLSMKFKYPLQFTPEGVEANLSFKGEYSHVFIPWTAMRCIEAPDGFCTVIKPIPTHPQNIDDDEFLYSTEKDQLQAIMELYHEQDPNMPKINAIDGGGLLTPPRRGHLRLIN